MPVPWPKNVLRSVEPEKNVVADTLVPLTDEAVTAVNTGEPITPTMGLDGVPPVYAFTPGAINVGAPIKDPKLVLPEKNVVADMLVPLMDGENNDPVKVPPVNARTSFCNASLPELTGSVRTFSVARSLTIFEDPV